MDKIAALIRDKQEIWNRPRHFRMRLADQYLRQLTMGRNDGVFLSKMSEM